MAEDINIDRKVFNKSQFVLAVDTKFSEFFAQKTPLTVAQFFASYNDLFFEIPETGNDSHEELIQRSTTYLGIDPFETERNNYLNQIESLELKIIELEDVVPEHPVFKNGSLLRYEDFNNRPEGGVVFYMDGGVRRKIMGGSKLVQTLIKAHNPGVAKNISVNSGEYIQNLPSSIMDQIAQGDPFTSNDFSGKNKKQMESKTASLLKKSIQQATDSLRGGKVKPNPIIKEMRGVKKSISEVKERRSTKKFITE